MIKIKYVINQIKNIMNKQNNVWNKRTYIIITILFETQSNIEKFLNGMVIRCWKNAYYFIFSVSFVSPTSVDNFWSSSGGEKECKRQIKFFIANDCLIIIKWYWWQVIYCLLNVFHDLKMIIIEHSVALKLRVTHFAYHIPYLFSISLMICKSVGLLLNFETMLPILIAHHIAAVAVSVFIHIITSLDRKIPAEIEKIRIRRKTIKK